VLTTTVLCAPIGKHWTFILGPSYICWDPVEGFEAKRPEFSNGSCGGVFIGDSTAREVALHGGVWVDGENCDSSRHTATNKVGRFKHPGAVGVDRHDDDVSRFDALIHDEQPPSGSQNRSSNVGYAQADSAHQHDRRDTSPPLPTSGHVLHRV
jgi:hypothetical protein